MDIIISHKLCSGLPNLSTLAILTIALTESPSYVASFEFGPYLFTSMPPIVDLAEINEVKIIQKSH